MYLNSETKIRCLKIVPISIQLQKKKQKIYQERCLPCMNFLDSKCTFDFHVPSSGILDLRDIFAVCIVHVRYGY